MCYTIVRISAGRSKNLEQECDDRVPCIRLAGINRSRNLIRSLGGVGFRLIWGSKHVEPVLS
jgi:hypothetical protein